MDIIGNTYKQNCGDFLFVEDLSTKRTKDGHFFYKCSFQNYPCVVHCLKRNILEGSVLNPQIEQVEFLQKEWPQNCGDSLKIIGKIWDEKSKRWNFNIEFIKYPYKKNNVRKSAIIKGQILNPQIEIEEFINKIWLQNCGDSLKILKKEKEQWKCEFLGYKSEVFAYKNQIIEGKVDNPNLPWKNKESLIRYIQENFKEKPTLNELSENLKIHNTTIGQYIDKFEIKDLISYFPTCSSIELEIGSFLKSHNLEIEESNWKILGDKEIDIYIPKKRIGIELNGNYWHSEFFKKYNYHQKKSLEAKEKGIDLIHIYEYEWINQKEKIKKFLLSKLELIYKIKIYARDCKIKNISTKIYNTFCEENHLQNSCGAKVKLGLFYEGNLIQIMSFGSPRFTSDNIEWEIIRECSKIGYIILGGKEKLWSYFIKNYNPNSVISYCDFSKFNGDSYLRLGFKQERLNKPGFVWWDKIKNIVYPRTPWKHQEYKNKNFVKIYDAGQLVFLWNK